ncbi:EAL domain-containing protein [Pseudoduganella sp. GCM10020061]|uniref:sensor domain-containing protein n=1 Tax=Pseudoduganella sp. GCM10020061 TaxID=3317345 RepID=UPI0036377024
MNPFSFPIAVFVIDEEGRIQSWNKACEKMSGFSADEIRCQPLGQIVTPHQNTGTAPLKFDHDCDLDAWLTRKDGKSMPVHVTAARHVLDPDHPHSYSVIVIPKGEQPPASQQLIQDAPLLDIIEGLPCVFYVIDQSGHLLLWNRRLEEALEMDGEALPLVNVAAFFDERERADIENKIREAFVTGSSSHEAYLIGSKGKRTPFLFNCALMSLGSIPCIFGTGLDISAQKETELRLLVRERAMYSSVNAIVITCCDRGDNIIEYVNPAFEQLTGYRLAEIKGRDPRFMAMPGCDEEERDKIRAALKRCESVRVVLRNRRKDGEVFWNDLRLDPVRNAEGKVTHYIGVIEDVTTKRQYERRLQHLANHDPLTGLANRALLQEKVQLSIMFAQRNEALLAVAFLDLDNFKFINDNYGHEIGDVVLKEVANRLRRNVREEDTVARLGGDEFVLVITSQPSVSHVAEMMERVRASVSAPVRIDSKEVLPGVSIGVSLYPRDGDTVDRLMRAADAAMYHAKTSGRNTCTFYSEDLNRSVHEHLSLKARLSQAIAEGQLSVGYQPKVDLRTGQVVGAEALVRWNDPEAGEILPGKFIPVAEETGQIVQLGEFVLARACETLRELQDKGLREFTISVNLSVRQLREKEFVDRLAALLAQHQLAPGSLELEVTESQLMDDPEEAVKKLSRLKELGVRLSIDDFGTGYSSLSYLQKFPVDYIKIDRTFLREVGWGERDTVIAKAIISLGHNLNLTVIAEGVETTEQMSFLRDHECDQMQGFYFSPALSREQLAGKMLTRLELSG